MILKLCMPIFASMLSANLMNLVDVVMISKLGPLSVSAVGYCFFLFWLSHSFFIGLGAAVQTYTARQIGQLNNGLCDPLRIGLKLTFSLSLIVTLIVLLFSDTLFTALIPDIDVKNEAQSYFNWRIWGLSALSLNIIYRAFYNGVKSPYFYLSIL